MIVVDTSVVSELMKAGPSSAVTEWVRARRSDELYTSAITVAEIRYGIERLPDGHRRDLLRATADDTFIEFADQVLPFDAAAAVQYASVVADRDAAGRPIDGFDAQIAAICRTHRATLATGNTKDFRGTGIDVLDPWQQP